MSTAKNTLRKPVTHEQLRERVRSRLKYHGKALYRNRTDDPGLREFYIVDLSKGVIEEALWNLKIWSLKNGILKSWETYVR